jgi:hypothetical protein
VAIRDRQRPPVGSMGDMPDHPCTPVGHPCVPWVRTAPYAVCSVRNVSKLLRLREQAENESNSLRFDTRQGAITPPASDIPDFAPATICGERLASATNVDE